MAMPDNEQKSGWIVHVVCGTHSREIFEDGHSGEPPEREPVSKLDY
jgi:hypothetical protein